MRRFLKAGWAGRLFTTAVRVPTTGADTGEVPQRTAGGWDAAPVAGLTAGADRINLFTVTAPAVDDSTGTVVEWTDQFLLDGDTFAWDIGDPSIITVTRDAVVAGSVSGQWAADADGIRRVEASSWGAEAAWPNSTMPGATTSFTVPIGASFFAEGETIEIRVFHTAGAALSLQSAGIDLHRIA